MKSFLFNFRLEGSLPVSCDYNASSGMGSYLEK